MIDQDKQDRTSLSEELKLYTERMLEIHKLSSPDILSLDNADSYSERLMNNFRQIGLLAAKNREMLDGVLYPALESEDNFDEELIGLLESFAEDLVTLGGEEDDFENLDLPIAFLISDKLLDYATKKEDPAEEIEMMNLQVDICYALMSMTERLDGTCSAFELSRNKGIELGNSFLDMLDKDVFLTIPEESRGTVLVNSRFMTAFFQRNAEPECNKRTIEILDHMLTISDDPFYLEAVPGYDWNYFRFRTLEYFVNANDINNSRGFNAGQLHHIADMAEKMEELCQSDVPYFSEIIGYGFLPVHKARCMYLDGRITREAYYDELYKRYIDRDKSDYGNDSGLYNCLLPLEILCIIDSNEYSASDALLLKDIYRSLTAYLFHTPSYRMLTFFMEYVSEFIKRFIEVPGGVSFEEFVLECMSALHPPTFIHSRMVALISSRIAFHIMRTSPEVFVGMPGFENVRSVIDGKDEILNYIYHAGLCHDFGKIGIIDTIFVYGRKLLDFEFDIIKSHPVKGSELLKKHYSTRKYADVALGHHRWYDDSKGYPDEFKTADSPYKAVIDIVQCADCMDAATDSVGRSYNQGKTLQAFMEELKEDSGTRYAPWLYDLMSDPVVYDDLSYLLKDGRNRNYKETYNLLKSVQDKG